MQFLSSRGSAYLACEQAPSSGKILAAGICRRRNLQKKKNKHWTTTPRKKETAFSVVLTTASQLAKTAKRQESIPARLLLVLENSSLSGVTVSLEHSFYPVVWLSIPISAHLSVTLGLKRSVTQFLMTTRSDGDPSHVLTECSHSYLFLLITRQLNV